jgi:glycerol uptake facilitator-like aquaporin
MPALSRKLAGEFIGTALLLATVVGSGIMGEKLAGGNVAIALLANTLATGAGLVALILTFGPISGAHFNPLVSLSEVFLGKSSAKTAAAYIGAQILGGIAGVIAANVMFELPMVVWSTKPRNGGAQFFSEFVATFGLFAVIQSGVRFHPGKIPFAVGAYITAAYWFTASTSFANPAVTLARCFTDTFAGIRPEDILLFVLAQSGGALVSVLLFCWLGVNESKLVPTDSSQRSVS